MERFTDAERKQLAFSVLIAGASVLSSAQVQQQGIQSTAGRPGSVQGGIGCVQLDLGSCSRTGTPASLQAASMRDAGHAYYASKCIGNCPVPSQAQQGGCHGQRVQGTMPAALEDSTSPLSSNSFALVGGILTPCGAEAVSAARVGCKRSYDAVEQQQQQQQYQQVLLSHHQQQGRAHQQHSAAQLLVSQQQQQARQQQALLLLKQRQAAQQQQSQLQKQAAAQQQQYRTASQLQQQLAAQQQQQHQQMQTLLAVGQHLASGPRAASAAVQDAVAAPAAAAAAASRAYGAAAASAAQQQQLLLMPQGSGTSTSSGFSSTTAPVPASASAFGAAAASSIWQQLVQAQDQKCQLSTAPTVHGPHVQQAAPLLGSASSITTSSSSTSSGGGVFASYLQQQQQQQQVAAKRRLQQQPPAKRAATQAAVAALLGASAAQGQQQLAATHGSSNSLQTLALLSPSAAATGPRRTLAEVGANHLLAWAGQILGCQLQDAYHLAAHIFRRTAGRLDDMLLISLGASLPVDSVTMLVSLWLATKLEGHRRQVAGCSKLAAALQLLPWAVTSIELHMMQLMDWQPYAGWPMRLQEPSCTVTEY
jgi:hypothetical protein